MIKNCETVERCPTGQPALNIIPNNVALVRPLPEAC